MSMDATRPRIGISACLMGEPVRYDGGACRDPHLVPRLSEVAELVPVCPEVKAGLGVPRPPIRLVRVGEERRVMTRDGVDHTDALHAAATAEIERIGSGDLCGFVVKSKSPSCGLERVRVYNEEGIGHPSGFGVLVEALRERYPLLPIEEEGRLRDPGLREAFFEAVFAYERWRRLRDRSPAPRDLIAFHARHKYQLLAHSPADYKTLGRLVAKWKERGMARTLSAYRDHLLPALRRPVSVGRHVNTLQHMMGHLRGAVSRVAVAAVGEAIDDYRQGRAARSVPATLIQIFARDGEVPYIEAQTYLAPFPKTLRRA